MTISGTITMAMETTAVIFKIRTSLRFLGSKHEKRILTLDKWWDDGRIVVDSVPYSPSLPGKGTGQTVRRLQSGNSAKKF